MPNSEAQTGPATVRNPEAMLHADRRHGRGARSNVTSRFDRETRETFDDGWESLGELEPFRTSVRTEQARTIVSRNDSPDISFDQSINPYRGCEHGCIYCYARPSHAFLGHSPGLDFETLLYAKTNAAELLTRELSRPGYKAKTIALGAVTDAYQPIERTYEITRQILEVMDRTSHPVGIVTKSALVVRDLDILARLASRNLVKVALSVTTLDRHTARAMEPRAATPLRRLAAIKQLADAGVPTTVMTAPIIPGLNDHEIEAILEAGRDAGADSAAYVMLRLPLELKDLFREWLATEFPDRANRVIKLVQAMHGGKDYDPSFGTRQRGSGPYAVLIAKRFRLALQRLGLNQRHDRLRTDLFQPPPEKGQLRLF
ncbi:MAG: PA0069 family radical SAM protein [Hyphomicrobiaceae bacterium]|nr:PA0069 family radical SAM protein [Hyphomicrobiaceae bacterium]